MINIVVELSKYVILTLMIVYTVLCYYLVVGKHASDRKGLLRSQITLTFFLDFTAFVVIFLKTFDFKVVIFYAEMMIYFAAILILYRRIYKNASMLLLKEQLGEVLKTLTAREEKVLSLRFGLEDGHPRTLEEVGKEFNVTRERIRQIEAKALRKLRHPSRSKKLKDFLD